MAQDNRLYRQRQLDDYSKLGENEFWHGFLKFIREQAHSALRRCAGETYTEQKIRYWQGAYWALDMINNDTQDDLISQYLKKIKEEADKG